MQTILTDVRWILFGEDGQDETRIEDSITREELLRNLKEEKYTVQEVFKWEELSLGYKSGDTYVLVTLKNYTSDVEEENYGFKTSEDIFLESVRRDTDLVPDFYEEWLRAYADNRDLTQAKYIANLK